jgi:hypothetical protein
MSLMTGDCGIFQVAAGIAAAASRVQINSAPAQAEVGIAIALCSF